MNENDSFLNFIETSEIEFKKLYGFTFVFEKNTVTINDNIASAEIKPVGIIYEENDEYYFAPLDAVNNINVIVEEFAKKYMSK